MLKHILFTVVLIGGFVIPVTGQEQFNEIGRWAYGSTLDVAFHGTYAFLGSGNYLLTLDIANPAIPEDYGELYLPSHVESVEVVGDVLYAYCDSRIFVFQIASDGSLEQLQDVDTGLGKYVTLAHGKDYVLATRYYYTSVYRRSANGTLTFLVEFKGYPAFGSYFATGNRIYGAGGRSTLNILDSSSPDEPEISTFSFDDLRTIYGVYGTQDLLFVADGDSVHIFNQENLTQRIGVIPGFAQGMVISGDTLYLAGQGHGTAVYDIRDPGHPVFLTVIEGWSEAVDIHENYLVIKKQFEGCILYDLSKGLNLQMAGVLYKGGYAYDLDVTSGKALLAYGRIGLQIVDLDFPDLNRIGTVSGQDYLSMEHVVHQGHYAYVAVAGDGIYTIDFSDPASPRVIDTFALVSSARDMALLGTSLYVVTNSELMILDVSNPEDLVVVGEIQEFTDRYYRVFPLMENVLYTYTSKKFLKTIDVSDPSRLQVVDSIQLSFALNDIARKDDHLYLGSNDGLIVNITDPLHPVQEQSGIFKYNPLGLEVYEDYLMVVYEYRDLQVLELSDPVNPAPTDATTPVYSPKNIEMHEDTLYYLDYANGLSAYLFSREVSGIKFQPVLPTVKIVPNPARNMIGLEWPEPPNGTNLQAQIYTASGERFSILPLHHRDGSATANVDHLPPGIYLVRVSDGDKIFAGRFIKL